MGDSLFAGSVHNQSLSHVPLWIVVLDRDQLPVMVRKIADNELTVKCSSRVERAL